MGEWCGVRSGVDQANIRFTPSDNNQIRPTAPQVNEKFARVFAQTCAWGLCA